MGIAYSIITDLKSVADEKRRLSDKRFFKEEIRNIGVAKPNVDKICKRYLKEICSLDSADILNIVRELLYASIYEAEHSGIFILNKTLKLHDTEDLYQLVINALDDNILDNWSNIDTISYHIIDYLLYDEGMRDRFNKLATHDNLWHRRIAIVGYIKHVKYGRYQDIFYNLVEKLYDDSEDLIHKALGWGLRNAAIYDKDRLVKFINEYGKKISRIMLRYSIEHFPKDERIIILQNTR